jgi:AraC-like DNA-binding protein
MDGFRQYMDSLGTTVLEAHMRLARGSKRTFLPGNLVAGVGLEVDKTPILARSAGRALRHSALMYVLEGHGNFEAAGTRRCDVAPGTAFYLYPGRWHQFDPHPGTVWTEYWVVFDAKEAKRRFGDIVPDPSRPVHQIGREEEVIEAYERLNDLWICGSRFAEEQSSYLLHRILHGVWSRIAPAALPAADELVFRLRQLVKHNLAEPELDFHELAASLGVSYDRFRKRVKAATGLAPRQFHIAAKVNRARQLILNSRLSVKEVAARLGFRDQLYFSRLFKSRTGLSPREFRKRYLVTQRR